MCPGLYNKHQVLRGKFHPPKVLAQRCLCACEGCPLVYRCSITLLFHKRMLFESCFMLKTRDAKGLSCRSFKSHHQRQTLRFHRTLYTASLPPRSDIIRLLLRYTPPSGRQARRIPQRWLFPRDSTPVGANAARFVITRARRAIGTSVQMVRRVSGSYSKY